MDSRHPSLSPRASRLIPAAVVVLVLGVVLGASLFLDSGNPADSVVADQSQEENSNTRPKSTRKKGAGYERISDEEYAKRAAESPDQTRVDQRFERRTDVAGKSSSAGLDWQSIGPRPFTEEYWSGNDLASGRISSIIIDPNDPDIAYAAAAQGGVWKTTDTGATWVPLTDHLPSLSSGALAFDPYDSDVIYYGTGDHHFAGNSFYGDGLFRSDDAGITWTKVAAKTDVGSYISRVVIDPIDADIIYIASDLGFVRSTDGGTTWNVELGPGHCTDTAFDPTDPSVVYCAFRGSGIWKSTNHGDNWTKLENGMPIDGFRRINFALAPSNPAVIYAAFATPGGDLYGMYKTIDSGASWSQLTATPDYFGGQGNYDNCIIVDPADEDICYAGGTFPFSGSGHEGLIRTLDGGASWIDINVGVDGSQPHPDHHIFAFGSDGRLWLGNDGGIWHTADRGQHWINCNLTLSLGQIYTNTIHPTNSNFILAGTQDNGSAIYEGNEAWPQHRGGDGGPNAIEWDSPNIFYSTYVQMKSLYKYDNGSWLGDKTGPWTEDRASWCNGPLVIDQNQPDALLVGTHRVWRSTDGASNWTALSGDLTDGGYLRSLAIAEGASNTIYSGSSDGLVFVTTDGVNWSDRSTGLPAEEIPDIIIDPTDWETAYLCADQATGSRIFFTDDAGVTWYDYTGDLPDGVRAMSMAMDFRTDPPRYYVGTDFGVYASFDDAWTWIKADASLPSLAVYDLTVDYANSVLLAGTHGRGAWRAALDVTEPTVALTSPIAGDSWGVGATRNITWTATDDTEVESVDIVLSRDGGLTWDETLASGIENTGTFTWTVTGPESTECRIIVYALDGSYNEGWAEIADDFRITGISSVGDDLPGATALAPAHPNPFNPRTTISYKLGADTHARLQVFSVDGRLIKTLVDRTQQAGQHQAVWNGTDSKGQSVASGNYLYTLTTTDGFRRTGKVLLVK